MSSFTLSGLNPKVHTILWLHQLGWSSTWQAKASNYSAAYFKIQLMNPVPLKWLLAQSGYIRSDSSAHDAFGVLRKNKRPFPYYV
jgi:hypothetical protein